MVAGSRRGVTAAFGLPLWDLSRAIPQFNAKIAPLRTEAKPTQAA